MLYALGNLLNAMTLFIVILLALLLDLWLGEPRRYHPLVAFGRLATALEFRLNRTQQPGQRLRGALAVAMAILPWVLLALLLLNLPGLDPLLEVLILYLAIGGSSLAQHGRAVLEALLQGNLTLARERVGWMVSRDTGSLDESGVARATVESVLENGNDALFGAIFWFVLLGAPGVILYRLANTLDAMWGYRTARFHDFGWAAARLDDLLNWLPARLTALSYLLSGNLRRGWHCWRHQGARSDSPNAGVVMASGAGALGLQLGGPAIYHGQWQDKPLLGEGMSPSAWDIDRAIRLVQRALLWWMGLILMIDLWMWIF